MECVDFICVVVNRCNDCYFELVWMLLHTIY